MFIRIREIKLPCNENKIGLKKACAKQLKISEKDIDNIKIYRRSLDARHSPLFIYTADVYIKNGVKYTIPEKAECFEKEEEYKIIDCRSIEMNNRPVVVGFGPCGMFCALVLARAGLKPLVIERGKDADSRAKDVERFFKTAELDENSNIQFGEGGAGTFSDGKLNTSLKDKNFRGRFVLSEFVKAGAPEEIMYISKPHIGTDRLKQAVKNIRNEIISLGGEVRFCTKLESIEIENGKVKAIAVKNSYDTDRELTVIPTDYLFLGIGHSARDSFKMLHSLNIPMERKIFSVGVRIEHKQALIDNAQYKGAEKKEKLPAADYKLVYHTSTGRALYTFCMCPGGTVVAAASEKGGIAVNGMSEFARDGENANSALLVNVEPSDLPGDDLFEGLVFQQKLEKAAFELGGCDYKAPAQLVCDYLSNRTSTEIGAVKPSYPLGVKLCSIKSLFPDYINQSLKEGLLHFDKLIPGFASDDAIMTAPESRSTSPIRIIRNEDMQSDIKGLYPIGEGAGYAGGIMSAAMDGMHAAEELIDIMIKE